MSSEAPIWKRELHTKAKHQILDRYLKAWFPIMGSIKKRIVYIDGFAGPGIYRDGEYGSPIIALNILTNHVINIKSEIVIIFVEQKKKRCEILQEQIDKIDLPNNITYQVRCDTFENQLTDIFTYLNEQEKTLAPSFVFIDPFGYAQTPFHIIEKLMEYPSCEFMMTFMYDYINRFIGEADRAPVFTKLFGTDEWTDIDKEETPEGRKRFIHDLYMKLLQRKASVKYLKSFEMMNIHNHTEYFLVYGTNHIKGLRIMKEAMWKVDPTGEYKFSDNTDPHQTVLFEKEPNYHQLKSAILDRYKGNRVRIESLEEFIIEDTPFLISHLRKPILIPMEKANPPEIQILTERKRKHSYPNGCLIKFL